MENMYTYLIKSKNTLKKSKTETALRCCATFPMCHFWYLRTLCILRTFSLLFMKSESFDGQWVFVNTS